MTIAEIYETMTYGPAPESASTALAWIAEQQGQFDHFIGGEWRKPEAGRKAEPNEGPTSASFEAGRTAGWRNGRRRKSQAGPKGEAEGRDGDASRRIGQKVERYGKLKAQAGDWPKSQLENLAADESWRLSGKAEPEIGRRRESQAGRKARPNGRSPVQIGGSPNGSQKTQRRLELRDPQE